jgi:AcrR family transcriptional regulator
MIQTPPVSGALRDHILDAAKALFIQHGYRGLSMRQIAEAVGVSKAALYYHFQDKEELFLAILSAYLDEIEALLDNTISQEITSPARIRYLVNGILAQPPQKRAVIRLANQEMTHINQPARQAFGVKYQRQFIDKVGQIMQEGIANGELRHLDAEVACWALLGILYPYCDTNHPYPLPAYIAEQIITIFCNGICTPTG